MNPNRSNLSPKPKQPNYVVRRIGAGLLGGVLTAGAVAGVAGRDQLGSGVDRVLSYLPAGDRANNPNQGNDPAAIARTREGLAGKNVQITLPAAEPVTEPEHPLYKPHDVVAGDTFTSMVGEDVKAGLIDPAHAQTAIDKMVSNNGGTDYVEAGGGAQVPVDRLARPNPE